MRSAGVLLDSITTDSGVVVKFYDNTNRYFGDFHCVRIAVTACPLENDTLRYENTDPVYQTVLDRMAVPGIEIVAVRKQLIRNFIENALPYMEKKFFEEFRQRRVRPGNER